MKKQHPSEKRDLELIARAVYFTAHIRLSPTEKHTIQCETKEKAFAEAKRLEGLSRFGREACVYAVTREGWTVPVDRHRTDRIQLPR